MPMPPLERKVELLRAGVTQTEIARRAEVSVTHVSEVLYGRRRSARVEQLIADALHKPVLDVFEPAPDRAAVA